MSHRPDPEPTSRREVSTIRHAASVTELLDGRDDLQGLHPLADLVYDAVRWSA